MKVPDFNPMREQGRLEGRAEALREVRDAILKVVEIEDNNDLGREEGFHSRNAIRQVLALFDRDHGWFGVKK
tara:strand:+ start:483 stop:698 length:216 start_codon:yes stop_codon:yes gene_type:complete